METYRLWIDDAACWGCQACEIACKQENNIPAGVKLIRLLENGPHYVEGKPDFSFSVSFCSQCEAAPCIDACPETAIERLENGIVFLDSEKCSGCRACVEACPFDAIAFDEEKSIAMKCNLCDHRVEKGLVPACADNICPAHCIYFGSAEEINEGKPAVS